LLLLLGRGRLTFTSESTWNDATSMLDYSFLSGEVATFEFVCFIKGD